MKSLLPRRCQENSNDSTEHAFSRLILKLSARLFAGVVLCAFPDGPAGTTRITIKLSASDRRAAWKRVKVPLSRCAILRPAVLIPPTQEIAEQRRAPIAAHAGRRLPRLIEIGVE